MATHNVLSMMGFVLECSLKTLKDINKRDGKLTREYEAIKDETQKKLRPLN